MSSASDNGQTSLLAARAAREGTSHYLTCSSEPASQCQEIEANVLLEERNQFLRELIVITENTPAVIARFDRSLRCIYMNPGSEKITARPVSWFLGRLLDDYEGYPVEAISKTKAAVMAVFETGQTQSIELTLDKPWGIVTFLQKYCPVYGPSGTIETVIAIGIDATEKARAQEALEHALKQQELFVSMVSHELRNPLAAISSALRILETEPAPEIQNTSRILMRRQLSHVTRLINDLLDTTQLERGAINFEQQLTSAADIIQLGLEIAENVISPSSHNFVTDLRDLDVMIHGDLNRLAQVISNLLHNAFKFTPPGGLIKLESAKEGHYLAIRVRDSGRGIDPAHSSNVFARYQQFSGNCGKYLNGMGFGLYLSKNIIEHHNGSIRVSSPGLNQGSVFEVLLPLQEQSAFFEPRNYDSRPVALRSAPLPILLVDDNEVGALTMKMLLELQGHQVTVAKNGYEALSLFKKLKPRVVLLDLGLPDINGCEVAKEIRSTSDDSRETLIIAMTGWGRAQDKEQSFTAGCNAHLTKPIDFDELTRIMGSFKRPHQTPMDVEKLAHTAAKHPL